jgi:uncharacterized integral membrane protein
MQKQFVFLLIVAILVAIFAITNAEVVAVRLFFWTYELSGSLVILFSVALGALLVIALNAVGWIKQRHNLKEATSKFEKAQKEIETIKKELQETKNDNEKLQQQVEDEKAKVSVAESENAQQASDSIL